MKNDHILTLENLLVSLLLILASCTLPKEEHLVIKPERTNTKDSVGQGIRMLVPLAYKKSDSSDQFETEDHASSLSVRISKTPVEDLKSNYLPEKLKIERIKLSEMSTVQYGDNKDGFFSKVYDEENAVFEYILAIQQDGKTYIIEAACTDISHDFYDQRIRQSLLSTYIE